MEENINIEEQPVQEAPAAEAEKEPAAEQEVNDAAVKEGGKEGKKFIFSNFLQKWNINAILLTLLVLKDVGKSISFK